MLVRIILRTIKKTTRVLLVGWTPKPPPDFEVRLIAVEHLAERTRQKVYRDDKAVEASGEPVVTIPEATPSLPVVDWGGPRHSDGTPVMHGDSFH